MKQLTNRYLGRRKQGHGMKRWFLFLIATLFFCCGLAAASEPTERDDESKGTASGLPLPRFASLRADEVNLRAGPGTRYPIEWVFKKEGLPVEITAEFDIWRRVRDWDGSEGWVHKSTLSGKRTILVTGGEKPVYKEPESPALAARVEGGSVGALQSCEAHWCKVKFDSVKGYMKKGDFWGAYETETLR